MLYDRYTGQESKMKKKKSTQILIVALLMTLLIFVIVTIVTAVHTYNKKVASENISEPDFYTMAEYSKTNSDAVMKALKTGKADKLAGIMSNPKGAEDVVGFADWSAADFDNAVSLGAGSFSTAPDKKGMMDISERFIVPVGEAKYVLYIETLTSRHGMTNDGVSSVGVTTYEHFNELGYAWNGEKDDNSASAGESFVKNK